MSRAVAHSSEAEWKALLPMLEETPIKPVSLATDTRYSAVRMRQSLEEQGIQAFIPPSPQSEFGPGGLQRV